MTLHKNYIDIILMRFSIRKTIFALVKSSSSLIVIVRRIMLSNQMDPCEDSIFV